MNPYLEKLKAHIEANPPNFGDGESVLTIKSTDFTLQFRNGN